MQLCAGSPSRRHTKAVSSLGFKPEERSGVFVSQQIQKTVRALPHFPDSLFEFDEQRLATGWLAFRVKNDPLQLGAAKGAH